MTRVAVYSDLSYRWQDGELRAEEAFPLFAAALRDHADRLVLVGRLDPGTSRPHPHRLRGDVELAPLPYYETLADPRRVALAVARSLWRFWRVLGRVDAVWLLGPHPLAVAFAPLAALRGRRVVLGVRQDLPAYVRTRHPGRRGLALGAEALERAWRALARRFPTAVVGADLAARYRRGRRVVPIVVSLVDDAAVRTGPAPPPGGGERRALSVGRLDPEKNPLLLADVLARLDESWRLDVCGTGPLAEELAARMEELGVAARADLRGVVPFDELRAAYESSDVLLHVSWTEGVPQVLLEAFAAGLPVVATDVGGVAEAAAGAAALIPPGDADAAAEAVARLGADRAERDRLVTAGLAHARAHTIQAETRRVASLLGASRRRRSHAARRNGSGPLVLCYHAVSDDWPSELAVAPAALERQLRAVLERGYRPATFSDALEDGAGRTFVVTFDDGYRSVLRAAHPVLSRLGVPGTVFVPTDWPSSHGPMRWPGIDQWVGGPHEHELAALDWDELRWLAAHGWEVGSHTRSHPDLTRLAGARLDDELAGSRAALEEQLGRSCRSLAYPYGAADDAVRAAAGGAGYRWAATLDALSDGGEPLACPRVGVYREDRPWRFHAKLSPMLHRLAAARRHARP